MSKYQHYLRLTQQAADLNNAAALLAWDQETYMPPKSAEFRGRQLATLAGQAHAILTSPEYNSLLQELSTDNNLSEQEADNIRLSIEDYEKSSRLPGDFVEELSAAASNAFNAWVEARRQNNFTLFVPQLENMLALKKQQAEYYGYEGHPYNALLDDYEKGATTDLLDKVFTTVKEDLPPLLQKITNAQQVDDSFFSQHYPKDKQWQFSLNVLKAMGYDFEAGRQDYSEHPFTTSFSPADVRVTTRVSEDDLASLLWSSIHEGGHALYEQGLPLDQYGMPLGAAASLSIHESQSRLWENCVGRYMPFWKHFYPNLQGIFPQQLSNTTIQQFYAGMNKVQPSLIRTEADELTYHFHVMIRYEIEKGLLTGDIKVADLPSVWNEYYERYLGVKPPTDALGVLQDVHWSHGSFGYFPTYSLGSFYAAQFYSQAVQEIQGLEHQIASGNLANLLSWLHEKVHRHGRRYRSEELCKQITGTGLDINVFMEYARNKYSTIYNI